MKAFAEELRASFGDRRLLALLLIVSPLVLLLFGYAARSGVDEVTTTVVGPATEQVEQQLPSLFDVVEADAEGGRGDAVAALREGESEIAVVAEDKPEVLIDGVSLFEARTVEGIVAQAPGLGAPEVLFNPELSLTLSLLPAVSGLVLLVASALALSGPLARDRESGRLAELSRNGRRLYAAVAGKLFFWLVTLAAAAATVEVLNRSLFELPYRADASTTYVACAVFALCALGIGTLIAALAKSRGKAIALSVGLIVPQILLSGAIFPIESIAPGLRPVTQVLPMTYVVELSQGVMLRGSSVDGLGQPLTVLAGMGIVTFAVGVLLLRRQLRGYRYSISEEPAVVDASEEVLSKA